MAVAGQIVDERGEYRRELERYRADYLAARAPLGPSLASGGAAGLCVLVVPLLVVLGSFLLLRLSYALVVPPAQFLMHLFQLGIYRPGRTVPTPVVDSQVVVPTPVVVEPRLEVASSDGGWVLAALLVLFWPVAMFIIGAIHAWLYRRRRLARFDELRRTPLELNIFPEWVLFYVLTAGAGLLVGVGSFVAIGLNIIFSWAGYLIWRWLHDRFLERLAPVAARTEARDVATREAAYRKELRESG